MFGCILNIFIVIWLVIKNVPIIPQHKTGEIQLTASNLKKKSGAHRLPILKIKVTIIGFSRPGPNVTYVYLCVRYVSDNLCIGCGNKLMMVIMSAFSLHFQPLSVNCIIVSSLLKIPI
jgi:hypothetical protein